MALSGKQIVGSTQAVAPLTATTVEATDSRINNLDISPAGLIAALTIDFNPTPKRGDMLKVTALGFGVTALTIDGNGNTIIGALTSLAINEMHEFLFNGTNWRKQ